jgi:hypothetical protein
MEYRNSIDQDVWWDNFIWMKKRIKENLESNDIIVALTNPLLGSQWDTSIRNTSMVIIQTGDTDWDKLFLDELNDTAVEFNIKFTLISNMVFLGKNNRSNIKLLTIKEFQGMYYNDGIDYKRRELPTKLYNCLIQRTTLSRLHMFSELVRNNLINKGDVSLLGYQVTNDNSTPDDIIHQLNNKFNSQYDDIVNQYSFPYTNFDEPNNLYDLEVNAKYSVVLETHNDDTDTSWVSFTEKTIRNLQIPNISLLVNSVDSMKVLEEQGFQFHPINHVLNRIQDFYAQTEFIIGVLEQDMFSLINEPSMALHNQELLKKWYDKAQTQEFYDTIVEQIL